ncbi:MAG TPA: nucleoside triphosphate pyrophosphohydrolase [Candidatus Limnocylindrales bacterium]|nr:nucleoside triphosphate pyrophosphohydrolase [Candidatus Limnocylindrales bacterium]
MLDELLAAAHRRWSLDPMAGAQVVPADGLAAFPIEPSRLLVVVPPARIDGRAAEPVPGRHGHRAAADRAPLAVLRRLYPADHPVLVVGSEGTRAAALADLDQADLAGGLAVPPLAAELAFGGLWTMPYISERLRRPDGCPWDREQTHQSLRKHLLEEAYEVYDALEAGATPALAGELGDLLLQVVLHAQLAAEAGVFDLSDVNAELARKIVRRHPHVFGEAEARTAADVNRQWERIKATERAEAVAAELAAAELAAAEAAEEATALSPNEAADLASGTARGALDGISTSLPALAAGQEMQERAAALGYDWPDVDGVLDKVAEELAELAAAHDPDGRSEEFGDLLLVVVNVGRKLGIESEAALRAANRKFRSRFRRVEAMVAERGVAMRDLDFAALDALWDAAKAQERSEAARKEAQPR